MMPDRVAVAVRVYDTADLPCLQSCLFPLVGQQTSSSPPLRIQVMTQRLTIGEVRRVREAVADLLDLDERISLTLHNWDYRDPFDIRVPLLNWALDLAESRYFTCLDIGDQLLPGTYDALLGRLEATAAAAALGGTWTQRVRWWGDVFLPLGPAEPPSAPALAAPMFLLDRLRLPATLRFRNGQPGQELAEFVAALRLQHEVDDRLLGELLCVRQVFEDN